MQVALSLTARYGAAAGGGGFPAQILPTPPVTMDLIVHPAFAANTLTGDEVQTLTELSANARVLTKGTTGPKLMTDALGQKFLRFEGALLARLIADVAFAAGGSTRNCKTYFVGRFHQPSHVFSFTGMNTSAAHLNNITATRPGGATSQSSPYSGVTNADNLRCGSEMVCISVGPNVSGSGLIYARRNGVYSSTTLANAVAGNTITGGASIGSYQFSGVYGFFDLYYFAVKLAGVSDVNDAAFHTELMDKFYAQSGQKLSVPLHDVVLEADSITANLSNANPHKNMAYMLTEPNGSFALPASVRVVSQASSGNTLINAKARVPSAAYASSLGGKAIYAMHGGRNDIDGGATVAQTNLNYQACLYDGVGGGVLERGWEALLCINTMDSAYQTSLNSLRALLRDTTTWDTAVLANPGNTYAGKVNRVEYPLIESAAGVQRFDTAAQVVANGAGWYTDSVHLSDNGHGVGLIQGGVTPQYGLLAAINARLAA